VQSVYTLQYGAGLALTTSKYYTPSGRNIQRDYSSFYDYYVADENEDGLSNEVPLKDRKQFKTDTGRVVYGGGGITPDFIVKPAPLTRTTQLLEVKSAIFNFGVDYFAKHPDMTKDLVEDFIRYAAAKNIAAIEDIRQALAKPNDRKYIERYLKAEIVAAKYGFDASYPFRLQGDDQIEKALDLFPQAQKLAMQAADIRANGVPGTTDAGSRAAQAIPRAQ
jgi:carboxyl-terminal processing protease